jgi:uncharacterized protein YcfL
MAVFFLSLYILCCGSKHRISEVLERTVIFQQSLLFRSTDDSTTVHSKMAAVSCAVSHFKVL